MAARSDILWAARWTIVVGLALYSIALSAGLAGLLPAGGAMLFGWIGMALTVIASVAALSVQLTMFVAGRRTAKRRPRG